MCRRILSNEKPPAGYYKHMEQSGLDSYSSRFQLTRRNFLKLCGTGFCAFSLTSLLGWPKLSYAQIVKKGFINTKLSPFYTSLNKKLIQCELCPRRCVVPKGKRGYCGVRENRGGKYYSLVYGNPCPAIDDLPIHCDCWMQLPLQVLPELGDISVISRRCVQLRRAA